MYSKEELIGAIKQSKNYGEVLSNLGRCRSGTAYTCLKQNIEKYEIDISHFKNSRNKWNNEKLSWEEILFNDQNRTHRRDVKQVRRALLETGRDHSCEGCGLKDSWQGKAITLEIDHIDGDWKNNTKENLRFLCPNCHSQTDTFFNKPTEKSKTNKTRKCPCGKSMLGTSKRCADCSRKADKLYQRKVERPSKETLSEEIENNSWLALGRKYGVSDNAVRKWAKGYGLL